MLITTVLRLNLTDVGNQLPIEQSWLPYNGSLLWSVGRKWVSIT